MTGTRAFEQYIRVNVAVRGTGQTQNDGILQLHVPVVIVTHHCGFGKGDGRGGKRPSKAILVVVVVVVVVVKQSINSRVS